MSASHHEWLWGGVFGCFVEPFAKVVAGNGFLNAEIDTGGIVNLVGSLGGYLPQGFTGEKCVEATAVIDMIFSGEKDPEMGNGQRE